jgi:hypothetical protein
MAVVTLSAVIHREDDLFVVAEAGDPIGWLRRERDG